ncbi:MAG TPA: retropepsin-like aspartic protease, partial [Minicystis sp.]|nr:retropepsin-like aspartic protease [Minicystis sp.]
MRSLVAALAFVSLAGCASSPPPPAASAESATVDVAAVRGVHGHVLVPVAFGARSTLFLLDSGASADGLSPAFAAKLGLAPVAKAEAVGAGGTAGDVPVVRIPDLRVGALVVPAHEGSVEDFDPEEAAVGGIFGRDLFRLRDVEVDLASNRVRLLPAGSSRARADLA